MEKLLLCVMFCLDTVAFSPVIVMSDLRKFIAVYPSPYCKAKLSLRRTQSLAASHRVKILPSKPTLSDLQVYAGLYPPLDTRDRLLYHPRQTPGVGCQAKKLRTKLNLNSPPELALTCPIYVPEPDYHVQSVRS